MLLGVCVCVDREGHNLLLFLNRVLEGMMYFSRPNPGNKHFGSIVLKSMGFSINA